MKDKGDIGPDREELARGGTANAQLHESNGTLSEFRFRSLGLQPQTLPTITSKEQQPSIFCHKTELINIPIMTNTPQLSTQKAPNIAGFHMTSLNFKLQKYWSSWNFTFILYESS